MPRTTEEILAHADELAKRFEDYEPKQEDERDPRALAAIRTAVVARAKAERILTKSIEEAKADGWSWASIGTELGTSGEAARQKYGTSPTAPTKKEGVRKAASKGKMPAKTPAKSAGKMPAKEAKKTSAATKKARKAQHQSIEDMLKNSEGRTSKRAPRKASNAKI
ncbi:conserved hypothetical protein (plasmid) [Rhodococcus jostii RHA1]|uniref:Uncharacterized protein n=1 Tax=Rhodococcus jostii (strain RHA1) TaxID=101510 RepID=Q0RUT4_RHOJR|nr:conserved hypothetical protein [Rhodococcus jostii RHA1]